MKPLKRGNTASEHYETITIDEKPYKFYNLHTSGLLRRNTILIEIDDSLREITAPSDLLAFKNRVITEKLTLSDLGVFDIVPEKQNHDLTEKHFTELSVLFPPHIPEQIQALHEYLLSLKYKSGVYLLKTELKYINNKNITIPQRIQELQNNLPSMKNYKINDSGVALNPDTEFMFDGGGIECKIVIAKSDKNLWAYGITFLYNKNAGFDIPYSKFEWPSAEIVVTEAKRILLNNLNGYPESTEINKLKNLLQPMEQPAQPVAEKKFNISIPEHAIERQRRISAMQHYGLIYNQELDSFEKGIISVTMDYLQESDTKEWEERLMHIGMELNPPAAKKTDPAETVEFQELPAAEEPETETPVSLSVMGNLTPNRIEELKGLEEKQLTIVKENPFVAITDAKSLKKAKAAESALLKASTAVDSPTTGIISGAKKYLKSLSDTVLNSLTSSAQITREAHEKQKTERLRFENAEEIRIQAERTAQIAKLNKRKQDLFDAGYIFNGDLYNIGNLFVTGTQIDTATDEEFLKFVTDGRQKKAEENDKDRKIRELEEKLAALKAPEPVTPVINEVLPPTPEPINVPEPIIEMTPEPEIEIVDGLKQTVLQGMEQPKPVEPAPATQPVKSNIPLGYQPETTFKSAIQGNTPLQHFDKAHAYFLNLNPIPEPFIKCRSYSNIGRKDLALEIIDILNRAPDPNGKMKSVMIKELCEIVIKQME